MASHDGASVNIYYVDGENGNDANAGTSTGAAWQTIQKGFDAIAAGTIVDGDELRIMKTSNDATYYNLTAKLTITWTNIEVVINGANDSGVVDGTVVNILGTGLNGTTPMVEISVATADQVIFSHLKFDANDTAQHCVEITVAGSSNMHWTNCQFTQATSHGVYTNNTANYWNFVNCRFDNNGDAGCRSTSSQYAMYYKCLFDNNVGEGLRCGSSARIAECAFYNNGTDGLYIANAGSVVCNCVFDSNTSDGAYVTGSGHSLWVNNLHTNNTGYGLVSGSGCENRHYNNAFYGNGSSEIYETGTKHLSMYNYISATDPSYTDAANFDFTPDGTSTIIGAGVPTQYQWFGSTADDIGLNKWRAEGGESISIF
jgi:hypothetical protein